MGTRCALSQARLSGGQEGQTIFRYVHLEFSPYSIFLAFIEGSHRMELVEGRVQGEKIIS